MKFHDNDDDDVVMEMEESSDYDAEILVDMLSGNQPSPIKAKEFSLLLSPYLSVPRLSQLESAPRRSTGNGKGASRYSLRKERETESPPTPIIQFDGDDSDSNYSDSFPEANNPQVLNLINLFNSFEDDFDDSDI